MTLDNQNGVFPKNALTIQYVSIMHLRYSNLLLKLEVSYWIGQYNFLCFFWSSSPAPPLGYCISEKNDTHV